MFAYCGNNPINYSDFSGTIRVCAEDRETFYTPVTTQSLAYSPEDQIYGIINGQGLLPYADDPIGLGSYGNSGCAYIAVYNALQLIGQGKTLAEITDDLFWKSVFFGAGGVSPWNVARYLSEQGVSFSGQYQLNRLVDEITEGSVVTFTVFYPSGWHAMTALYKNEEYWVFNEYNNSPETKKYSSLEEVCEGGVFVYGIRIDP